MVFCEKAKEAQNEATTMSRNLQCITVDCWLKRLSYITGIIRYFLSCYNNLILFNRSLMLLFALLDPGNIKKFKQGSGFNNILNAKGNISGED